MIYAIYIIYNKAVSPILLMNLFNEFSKEHLILFLFVMLSSPLAISQSNEELANDLNIEAIKLMDQGEIDQSLELLLKARKLDPQNIDHPYEMGYAYYKKQEFAKSIEILETIKSHPSVYDLVYVQLGNSYDMNGNTDKAFETYQIGMNKFPDSGRFDQELGNIAYAKEEYNKAVSFWKKGLQTDPNYSTNYYKLAKIFSFTKEKIWTLIYGEIFVLLEPDSQRTEEISKLLFQTYQEIHDVETKYTSIDLLTDKGFLLFMENNDGSTFINKPEFPMEGAYAHCFLSSARYFQDEINFSNLAQARNSFLDCWFKETTYHKIYPNKLLDHQKLTRENNVFEAYTYWLLSQGNPEEFQTWYNQNEEKISEFGTWFDKNRLQIDKSDSLVKADSK